MGDTEEQKLVAHDVKKGTSLPEECLQKLEALCSVEEKLEHVISFMEKSLQERGGRHFLDFWNAQKLCTGLFSQPIHPSMRTRLWEKYATLCREARTLKDLFDEESAFLSEQIEKAIEAVATELSVFEEKGSQLPPNEELLRCFSLKKHAPRYEALYQELTYLNSFASRIISLRKELITTEIRFKQKHKLLDRLDKLGNIIFPKRKQAMSEESALFVEDVEAFAQSADVEQMRTHDLFAVQDEIKCLQGVAKILTLGTDAFSRTRTCLSECWDRVKHVQRERKKAEQEKAKLVKEKKEEKPFVHGTKDEVCKKVEKERATKYDELVVRLKRAGENGDIDAKEEELCEISLLACEYALSRQEKHDIEKQLSGLRRRIVQMREAQLDTLTGEALYDVFVALEHMKAECKNRIEIWRKETSGSNSDFFIAMQYRDLIEEERAIVQGIEIAIEKGSVPHMTEPRRVKCDSN